MVRKLDPNPHGFNFDDITIEEPHIWEYINEGYYTRSGNGLGCLYTLHHSVPEKDNQLWLVHDMYYGDMYLVVYSEGYILNRANGKICEYDEVNKKDLDILKKYDINEVISTLKYRK